MTEDHLSSVNLTHSVHEWTQVGPHDQVAGERVMLHLREVVVGAAAPLLQVEEGAEGAEEYSQMKVVVVVGVVEGAEEHSQMKAVEEGAEEHSQMKVVEEGVEGVNEHYQIKVVEGAAAVGAVVMEEGPHMKVEVVKH